MKLEDYEALAGELRKVSAPVPPNHCWQAADAIRDLTKRVREEVSCRIQVFNELEATRDDLRAVEHRNAQLRARVEIQDEAIKAARAALPVRQRPPQSEFRVHCNLLHGLLDVDDELAALSPSEAEKSDG